jgi:hypothetical protein
MIFFFNKNSLGGAIFAGWAGIRIWEFILYCLTSMQTSVLASWESGNHIGLITYDKFKVT